MPETDGQEPNNSSCEPERLRHGAGNGVWYAGAGLPRRLSVKGSGGITATVVVVVRQGKVMVSIIPPFTWEVILEPGKVDDLVRALAQAGEDAKRIARTAIPENTARRRYQAPPP